MYQWTLQGKTGFDSLKYVQCAIPEASGNEVLVKFHSASLNYRDLMIAKVSRVDLAPSIDDDSLSQGTYYWPTKNEVVPG